MDVTCNRCNTEYEFEEALVSSRGTTVKCTHCGHLFKVQRASRSHALSGDSAHWTVRQTDGRATTLDTLSGLPSLIAEGKLGRDDELSRTGRLWRRLGDIEELDEHFSAADRRGPSRVQPQLQAAERDVLTPPAADPVASSEATTVRKPLLEQPPAPDIAHTTLPSRGVRHESRDHAWARLLTSAAIVIAIAIWFFSLPPTGEHFSRAQTEKPADPSARFLAAGASALAAYRLDQFDQAQTEYIKALAFREHDAGILSALSRVHALWAEELRSQRELGKLAADSAPSAALDAQEIQAQLHAQRAKHYAQLALQGFSGNSDALLAESDALRLLGDLPGARAALAHAPSSPEALRVSALLDPGAAVELATRAVSADPKQLATRFLLARLLFARGDAEGVRAQLQAITAQAPKHPEAARLEALLVAREAPLQQAEADAQSAQPTLHGEAESFIERGRNMLEAGQTAGAKRMFDHALTLQPNLVPAHAGLGQVAIARGRPVQAIDHLVAAALGGDGDSLIALAELYRRLGRQREALAAYQSYL
ncbi:MAG TPA: tetratricopeptide repeat protein, partial [Polyangiales bacterium]|nr:tetratricopeptide repeat protein [Polyangiales bacterium]